MKPKVRLLRKQRAFSKEFKKELVSLFEQGKLSVNQLLQLYLIAPQVIYRWIYKFSKFNKQGVRVVEMKESISHKLKELAKKVKELEQIVGQKQIKIDYLEKMIDIAKEEVRNWAMSQTQMKCSERTKRGFIGKLE